MLKVKDLINKCSNVNSFACYLFLNEKQVKSGEKYLLKSNAKKYEFAQIEIDPKYQLKPFRDNRGKYANGDIIKYDCMWCYINNRACWRLETIADFLDHCQQVKLDSFSVAVDENTNKNTMTIIFILK